jgi:hypothetical protein
LIPENIFQYIINQIAGVAGVTELLNIWHKIENDPDTVSCEAGVYHRVGELVSFGQRI